MDGLRAFAGLPLLVLALIAAMEAVWLVRRGRRYDWKGYWASLGDAVGRALLGLLVQGGVVGALLFAIWEFRLTTIAMDGPGTGSRSSSARNSATTRCTAPTTACAGSG